MGGVDKGLAVIAVGGLRTPVTCHQKSTDSLRACRHVSSSTDMLLGSGLEIRLKGRNFTLRVVQATDIQHGLHEPPQDAQPAGTRHTVDMAEGWHPSSSDAIDPVAK